MSTCFTTEPRVPYERALASRSLVVEAPGREVYAGRRHAFLRSKSGSPAGRLTVYEDDDGNAGFERFGAQSAELLLLVAAEHGVQVRDEHGLLYPAESDG